MQIQNGAKSKMAAVCKKTILKCFLFNILASNCEQIAAGNYSFPFEFRLPPNAPPTFQSAYGQINYSLNVTVITANNENERVQEKFRVRSIPIDLRHRSELFDSSIIEMHKKFGVLCCFCGTLDITVRIERGAFKAGDSINLKVSVENGSFQKIEAIQFTLTKNITYMFQAPKTDETVKAEPICSAQTLAVMAQSSNDFDIHLVIPSSLAIVDLKHCKLIKQNFVVAIKAIIAGPYFNLQDTIPVEIADILTASDVQLGGNYPVSPFANASAPNM